MKEISEFSGYEKMPNSLKKLGYSVAELQELDKLKWVVTEKIHGANFSFVYEKGKLKFAKRKDYLAWTDDFFGFQLVVNQLENQIIQLFEKLSTEISAKKYIVYGELFGGEYPKISSDKNIQAIQTGISYSPIIQFCAFDIAFEINGEKEYLAYEKAIQYFDTHQIFYAKPLAIGKFTEALNFDVLMNSTIPSQLNLPELANNLIEGVVIKPYNKNQTSEKRAIIKLKNPDFEEQKKFHEAVKWTYIPSISSNTEELEFIVEELRNYITKNRIQSAISKIGSLDFLNQSRVEEVQEECLQDALVDFNEENNDLMKELTEKQQTWICERINVEIIKKMRTS